MGTRMNICLRNKENYNHNMEQQNNLDKKVVMVVAFNEFKDEEYFIPKKILEEAGFEIITASNNLGFARSTEGGKINVDILVNEMKIDNCRAIIFIGGPGCLENLDNSISYEILKEGFTKNKVLAAICIAPVIFAKADILRGRKATVWSSMNDQEALKIIGENGGVYQPEPVVVDGRVITANGPEAAEMFARAIVRVLTGIWG